MRGCRHRQKEKTSIHLPQRLFILQGPCPNIFGLLNIS